ncbi:hypothetical protein LWI28_020680 [Acer negundo]|uniref:Bifunctional inhibitor/plant lipid transfer protein/seed storage helical domain-containing protein n=1 Tax=Acer negundo TaxID=4023 RepID=A0AAD5NK79_ACENE|nr:hypothetical protein LWI28_020680 [Acer negundo]KAK4837937.1 hypothetical protein QYF36_009673 [Acer negundo]
MTTFKFFKVALIVVLVSISLIPPHVNAEVTCEQITMWLTPCIGYSVLGGVVPAACCEGIKTCIAAKKTKKDRQLGCNCVKDLAAKIPGLNYDRVNEIPGICGTTVPYKITPDLDCSKVN